MNKKSKGFTLIELLVLIAIIGIIFTIIFSSIKRIECKEEDGCDVCKMYENYPVKDVPAKCLSSFGIKSITQ